MVDYSGEVYYYLTDHLGSTRIVLKESDSTVMDTYSRYMAFGEDGQSSVSTSQKFRYTGKPFDDDGGFDLYYYGARYYDAKIGRFTQIDPAAANYLFLSPYSYCADNPLKNIDPDGRDIALAIDHTGASGMGHAYLFVGNDDDGWQAISFGPKSAGISMLFGDVEGEMTVTKVIKDGDEKLSLQQILDNGSTVGKFVAHDILFVPTERKADEIALMLGNQLEVNPGYYNLYNRNCVQIAIEIANKAGVLFNNGLIPNTTFSNNAIHNIGELLLSPTERHNHLVERRMRYGFSFGDQNIERNGRVTVSPIIYWYPAEEDDE